MAKRATTLEDEALEFVALVDRARRGTLWRGVESSTYFLPVDVIALTLSALRRPHEPARHSGAATLVRFAAPGFRPVGFRAPADPFHISKVFDDATCPTTTLDDVSAGTLALESPAALDDGDTVYLDPDAEAWHQVRLECPQDRTLRVLLGWQFARGDESVWRTSNWQWHDFRPEFHPGLGEEEWTRICG